MGRAGSAPAARPGPAEDRRPANTLRLVRLAKAGDRDAEARLMEAHRGLVGRCIRVYAGDRGGQTGDELESSGLVALWQAIHSFDESFACEFSTHATWKIWTAMKPTPSLARQFNNEQAGTIALGMLGMTLDESIIASPVDATPPPDFPLPEQLPGLLAQLRPRQAAALRFTFGMPLLPGDIVPRSTRRLKGLVGRALRALRALL